MSGLYGFHYANVMGLGVPRVIKDRVQVISHKSQPTGVWNYFRRPVNGVALPTRYVRLRLETENAC